MSYAERVLQPGETIAYRARLHWIVYLSGMLLVGAAIVLAIAAVALRVEGLRVGLLLGALVALVLGLTQAMRAWLKVSNTEIVVTNRRVIYKTGFIARNTLEMNLDKVESVLVNQGLLGRVLGYGTVTVRGVGSGLEPMAGIADPLDLHRYIGSGAT